MRIGIDIRSLLEPYPSGISAYTRHIIDALLRLRIGDEFVFFSNAAAGLPKHIQEMFPGPRVRYVDTKWPNKLFNVTQTFLRYPALDRFVGGVDVFFFPNLMFGAVSRRSRLVITAHDLSFQYPGFYRGKSRIWHRVIRPERLYHRADHIIAVSESTKRDVVNQFGIDESRVSVIYHGIDPRPYEELDDHAVQTFRDTHQLVNAYALFVGTITERKNVESILTAWSLLRQRRAISHDLVIAGHTPDATLRRRYPEVHFLGYIPDEWKPPLYRGADVVIYPSFHEGFGLPILEAFTAGTPVVTSHGTALSEIAETAAVTVNPYNHRELAVAIEQLLHDQELRHMLIARGRIRAQKFTWTRAAEQTYRVLTHTHIV